MTKPNSQASFKRNAPYNDLPSLPPCVEIETKAVLKECIVATQALAELKGAVRTLPDPTIIINSLPLQEAKMSSEIENIVTTQDKLFEANLIEQSNNIDNDNIDLATKEVVRYRAALRFGFDEMKTHNRALDFKLVRDVCSVLRGKSVNYRDFGQNVIIGNYKTREAKYTPPEGGAVLLDKLSSLEDYMLNFSEHTPLIKMALIHYQFESIHPFDDGNGRAGRMLNILYLVNENLLDLPILYLSKFIIENKEEYYRLFTQVTEEAKWEDWLLYMLRGITSTAILTTNRVNQIGELFEKTNKEVKEKLPKIYNKELMEIIFRQPYTKISFLEESGLAKRQTAKIYLKNLVEIGVLKEEKRGREKLFINTSLLNLLKT